MSVTEWWGTCRACSQAGVFPVTETDHGDLHLQCDSGHGFWVTPHDPGKEPR